MNTISNEICRICNIQPIYSLGFRYETLQSHSLVDLKKVVQQRYVCPENIWDNDWSKDIKINFPDFDSEENFAQLLYCVLKWDNEFDVRPIKEEYSEWKFNFLHKVKDLIEKEGDTSNNVKNEINASHWIVEY